MKQYQLQTEHGGFPVGTLFEGPKPIPDSVFQDTNGITHSHTNLGEGYFEVGKDSGMCFFREYVESNQGIFKEVTQ